MKKGLFSLMAFFAILCAVAQPANKQGLDSAFHNYFRALEKKDIAKIISYLPHQLFAIADRAELESEVGAALNHEDFAVDFSNMKINKIADIQREKGIAYSLIHYEFQLTMKEKKSDGSAVGLNELYESYKSVMDENQLKYDEANKTLTLLQNAMVYAIHDPAFKGWKFIDNQMYLAYSDKAIIPSAIAGKPDLSPSILVRS